MEAATTHQQLVEALRDPAAYPHAVDGVEVCETHISTVLLAGAFAYKIKKPVDLGFLDFSSLSARHYYCEEEIRANARLAPDIYVGVVPVVRQDGRLVIGQGPERDVVDYAVRMRRFPQEALLGARVTRAAPEPAVVDRLAAVLARFHAEAPVADPDRGFGDPEAIRGRCLENLDALPRTGLDASTASLVESVDARYRDLGQSLAGAFRARQAEGYVRECHGDLHLDNILVRDGEVSAFDAIEFAPDLRWIDTASDLAFPVMDLWRRDRAAAAHRLRSEYLAESGDYDALRVLPFYIGYRALVRAKIAALTARGAGDTDELAACLRVADAAVAPRPRRLLITHGPSGCGKSTVAMDWVEREGAIRIRSDVERKRLFGLSSAADSASGVGAGLYSDDATEQTYERLASLAETAISSGHTALVDATFLTAARRERFAALADALGASFGIIAPEADEASLRARVRERAARGGSVSEADEEVLDAQLARLEPLREDERARRLTLAPAAGHTDEERQGSG